MKNKIDVINWLKTTPVVQVACQKAGVGRSTYYTWRKKDKKFKKNSDCAIRKGNNFINDLAKSKLIGLVKEGHPTSVYYWLNHKHPEFVGVKLKSGKYPKNSKVPYIEFVVDDDPKPWDDKTNY